METELAAFEDRAESSFDYLVNKRLPDLTLELDRITQAFPDPVFSMEDSANEKARLLEQRHEFYMNIFHDMISQALLFLTTYCRVSNAGVVTTLRLYHRWSRKAANAGLVDAENRIEIARKCMNLHVVFMNAALHRQSVCYFNKLRRHLYKLPLACATIHKLIKENMTAIETPSMKRKKI